MVGSAEQNRQIKCRINHTLGHVLDASGQIEDTQGRFCGRFLRKVCGFGWVQGLVTVEPISEHARHRFP